MQQNPSLPPAATPVTATPATPSAAAIYEALTNQKNVLQGQMSELADDRSDLVHQLSNATESGLSGPAKTGLEDRIAAIDKRIAGVDQQIALTDAQLSKAAAVPGAIVPHVEIPRSGPPDEVYVLAGIFMFVFLMPLSIAFARRIWKRSSTIVQSLPADLMARIQRIEQAVESSGLEIERIGEGQRFITKLFSEKLQALPSPRSETREP